jgi:predicted type IV restriction endonuclease
MASDSVQIELLTQRVAELERENLQLHAQLQAAYRAYQVVTKTTRRVTQSHYWIWILKLYEWRDRVLPAGRLTLRRLFTRQ